VVLYSYSKLTLGNDTQYVLVPQASKKLKVPPADKLLPSIVNGTFKELRNRKRTTYGDTSLDVSAKSIGRGLATVKLDKAREKYHPIIVAEVVYTLTQLGLEAVSFPGYNKKALGRDDIPFASYRLRVPALRALPPARIPTSTIIMPDGTELDSDTYAKKVAAKAPEIIAMLGKLIKDKDVKVVKEGITSLTSMSYDKTPDMLLPLLKDRRAEVRLVVLTTLQSSKRDDILDAISGVMDSDKDKAVALKASEILGASSNKKFSVRALFFALRGDQEGPAIKAIKTLSASKDPVVATELVKATNRNNPKIAAAAIDALAQLKLTPELLAIMDSKKRSKGSRLQAAALLLSNGDKGTKFKALSFQLVLGDAALAQSALETISTYKDPDPRLAIESCLIHDSIDVRHEAARRLGEIKNPDSLKALAKAGTRPEDSEIIQDISSKIMATLTMMEILQYTTNRNIILKRVAYLALGVKSAKGGGGAKVFEALAKGVKSKDGGIRGASVRAMGSFTKKKASLGLVLSLSKDNEAIVRRDVARALGAWPSGTNRDTLLIYMQDPEGIVVEAALDALRVRKEDDVYMKVLKLSRAGAHPHPGVRGAIYRALAVLGPKKARDTVISTISGGLFDKNRDVKLLSIDLLGAYDSTLAVTSLAALINDPVEEYRVKSLLALGDTGSKDAIELITSVFTDKSVPVRVAAMTALGRTGLKEAKDAIKIQMATETDLQVIKAGENSMKKLK
jgi:HEAT repeat protein